MFNPGDRVMVKFEGMGFVFEDHGFDRKPDQGVDVKIDSDGIVLSCAHAQVEKICDHTYKCDCDTLVEEGK
jgi:hypothetical protein